MKKSTKEFLLSQAKRSDGRSNIERLISEVTGLRDPQAITQIEMIMRDEIFHSTLDWQTREQLKDAARQAANLFEHKRCLAGAERNTKKDKEELEVLRQEVAECHELLRRARIALTHSNRIIRGEAGIREVTPTARQVVDGNASVIDAIPANIGK